MNTNNNILNQFDLACGYFEDVQQLENIGTPTIQNAEEIATIIHNIDYITGGNDAQFSSFLDTAIGQQVNAQVEAAVNTVINYMSNIIIEVQQPNQAPGNWINLYVGTVSEDDDGNINENFQDTDGDGDPVAANLWEIVSEGPNITLFNDQGDAQINSEWCNGNWRQALGCNWGYYGSMNYFVSAPIDDYGDQYVSAEGTLAQWLPFIYFDTSNADTAGEQQAMTNFANTFG